MSIFSKIKQNFSHGGVDIDFQAPASASMQDATIPIQATITASDQQQTINRVSAEIIRSTRNAAFNQSRDVDSATMPDETVARIDNTQPFTLAPGQSQTVNLSLVMNAGAAIQEQLPQDSGMAQVAGALSKLQSVGEALNGASYTYSIQVSADVEGITLDPAKTKPIQLLKPGEIGTAFNIGN